MPDVPKLIQLPTVWVGTDDLPVHFANAFIGVVAPGEIFLNIGALVPPAIMGATEQDREAQVRSVAYVPVKPIARLGLTPERLDELITALQQTRENYQALTKMMENQEG